MSVLVAMNSSEKTTPTDVFRFIAKCTAEAYYCSGQFLFAIERAYAFAELLKNADSRRLLTDDFVLVSRYVDVYFAEAFIMIHELYHRTLKLMPDEERSALIKRKRDHLLHKKPFERYWNVIYIKLEFNKKQRHIDEMRWLNDDENIIEILCDEYAFKKMLKVFRSSATKDLKLRAEDLDSPIFWFLNEDLKNDMKAAINSGEYLSKQDRYAATIAKSCILCLGLTTTLLIAEGDAKYYTESAVSGRKYDESLTSAITKNVEVLLEDAAYRFNYFIFDTVIENVKIVGSKKAYLAELMESYIGYHEKILDVALQANYVDYRPDLFTSYAPQIENGAELLNDIPNWGCKGKVKPDKNITAENIVMSIRGDSHIS